MSYPTAWMSRHDNHIVTFDRLLVAEAENAGVDNWIPLYTSPQTKPLSDEEIDDIWAGCSTGDDVIDMHDFARAIEAKVRGEK